MVPDNCNSPNMSFMITIKLTYQYIVIFLKNKKTRILTSKFLATDFTFFFFFWMVIFKLTSNPSLWNGHRSSIEDIIFEMIIKWMWAVVRIFLPVHMWSCTSFTGTLCRCKTACKHHFLWQYPVRADGYWKRGRWRLI